jgi:hypothetical protein
MCGIGEMDLDLESSYLGRVGAHLCVAEQARSCRCM